MSKLKFTAQTETIETNPDMLNYYYFDSLLTPKEVKDILIICEKLSYRL